MVDRTEGLGLALNAGQSRRRAGELGAVQHPGQKGCGQKWHIHRGEKILRGWRLAASAVSMPLKGPHPGADPG